MIRKVLVKCVPHFKGEWSAIDVSVSEDDVAEDVVIQLSKDLKISPISRHMFALFHPHSKLWLSPNQKILQWLHGEQSHVFELRVRFKPTDLDALKKDQAAFDYYFFQVRYDFRKKQKSSHAGDKTQRVLGLFIADIISYVLETYPDLDEMEAEEKLKEIPIKDFLPLPFAQKLMLLALNADCRNQMVTAWSNSHHDANTPKQEYLRTLLDGLPDMGSPDASAPLWPQYHVEQYSAQLAVRDQQVPISLDFQPIMHAIRVKQKCNTTSEWSTMCSVEELCFIAVKAVTKTIEVSRINGIPHNLSFATENELKSFVSLLDGYYRLSQKWSFSICKDISSPSLTTLKSLKCHGPVGAAFAVKKLQEKAGDKAGTYVLRQSGKNYSDFVVDVCCGRRRIRCLRVTKAESGFVSELFDQSYACLSELLSGVILTNDDDADVHLLSCIPPSENDKSDRLLMCRLRLKCDETAKTHTVSAVPIVYSSHNISNSHTCSDGQRYKVTVGLLDKDSVVVKEAKQERDTVSFLKTVNDWVHLKSDCLVAMRGVVMFPPSLVMDYYSLGPLDEFLVSNQSQLKPVDLIESATYCARALWYLEEKKLVHGSIRCHNLLVSAYTPSTLKVKLSDPLSNWSREAPWIAPEEQPDAVATAAGDVWAFGTTLWEIFCYGRKPAFPDVGDLVCPFGCPEEVWKLIHGCWETLPEGRKQPQELNRDISQILYEVYNSRRTNYYSTLNDTKEQKLTLKFVRPFFGSSLSLRSSIMSTSTLLTGLGSSRSDLISLCSRDPDEVIAPPVNESWLIEANQLSLDPGKILGQGCYGEVVKAVLTKWCGLETEVVAVKRINQNVPIDSGLKDMRREIEIMKKLSHRNIVEIKGFVEDPQLMLVMEYLELGSLISYLKVHKHRMLQHGVSQLPFKKFALDIVDGMKYLESRKIVHRDLAARNILVASDCEVKISDFGLAQVIKEGDYYRMRTQQCLPLRWYAPESIMRGTFTHKSDVWSFGVTMWEMFSFGKDPVYPECDHDSKLLEKLEEGKRLECPENCPLEVYEIMRSCWKTSSDERPSFERLELDIRATSE